MEKSFIWYPVYKKLPDTNRIVIIQCEGLDEPTIGCFNSITRSWTISEVELNQELNNEINLTVVAWMEMPPKYMDNAALEFRTAAETRYFMSISANKDENINATNFHKIRNAIYCAAQKGFNSCEIIIPDMSEELIKKLYNGGYVIKANKDCYTISWA